MKKSRFKEEQFIKAIKLQESVEKAVDICRDLDISRRSFYKRKARSVAWKSLKPISRAHLKRKADGIRGYRFKDAPLDQKIQAYALTAESNLNNLIVHPTEALTVNHPENNIIGGEIYEIYIDGDSAPALRVTANHPLVNDEGEILAAGEIKTGTKLLSTEGSRLVSRLEKVPYDGAVHNILPTSKELNNNILVMDKGILVGSQRVQNKEFGFMKRAFYRQTVVVD